MFDSLNFENYDRFSEDSCSFNDNGNGNDDDCECSFLLARARKIEKDKLKKYDL